MEDVAPRAESARAAAPQPLRPEVVEADATRIASAGAAPVAMAAAVAHQGIRLQQAEPAREPVRFPQSRGDNAVPVVPEARPLPRRPLLPVRLDRAEIGGAELAALSPQGASLRPGNPRRDAALAARPKPMVISNLAAPERAAQAVAPGAHRIPVLLAWSGDLSLELRQETLDVAAALRVSDPEPEGHALRDELADRLAEVRCARVQTSYDPASGALDLLGHVRTDADRDALLAAVERELNGAVPVVDRLRRLGEPQCAVLGQLSEMPLPQSVEQFTNPLIIGPNLHTRVYSFADGEDMRFTLAGADYDGWLYLDYYDSDGLVLHLAPNAVIGALELRAEQAATFGGGGPDDMAGGRVQMRVSPPFGQDIAVAIVASRPLFDIPRETVEAAGPYLAELSERIRALRRQFEDFKGEWVYLFVETRPGG